MSFDGIKDTENICLFVGYLCILTHCMYGLFFFSGMLWH